MSNKRTEQLLGWIFGLIALTWFLWFVGRTYGMLIGRLFG